MSKRYFNPVSEASFRSTLSTPRLAKSISHHHLPVESNRHGLLLEVANQALQPDVTPRNLYRASAYIAESKRLILVERRQILHRGTWLALATLAEALTHLLVALDRLSAAEKEENDAE